ncbi:cardiolipin synthase B [Lysobacter sp. TY2-98]|uniref:phospholipase D-like domain-containing protein n=1 Tax=Lysobacter sp. TY2-98 TaxID=2290922 RepID=UPI000E2013A4|nr:phospholipase D-like domain-containing protein [Lysobacter sp. TY2-98]AXK71612.1 cardiolipin synthase B [Lysobacter sp. TY2-98]
MFWTIALTALATVLLVVIAMNFATPEKKLESRVVHKYASTEPQFLREMGVMLGPSIVPGNKVTVLEDGDQIFPAMLEAIAGAKRTVTFETYIWWEGEIAKKFSAALCERAQAGVAVNVTVDWAGSIKMDSSMLKKMQDCGVHIERYRPLHWYNLGRLNNRTHRKLLVVDGRVGFTGGVGIGDPWLGHAQDPDHWHDLHFKIEGPVVSQVQAAFNDNWIKTTGRVLNGETYFPAVEPAGNMSAHMFIASPAGGAESMHLMFLMAIAAAKTSIDIEAAYFIPDPLLRDALMAARHRGVRVRLLLPGPYIDSETVRIATKKEWGPLLAAGAEMHLYQPTMLHVKLMIIDKYMVSVGSTNLDQRSFQLNDEASLNVYDADFAEHMTQVFERDLKSTKPYTYAMWASRPWKEKMSERFIVPIKSQL